MAASPVQLQKHLSGIDYPVGKQQLVEHVRSQGADEQALQTLERLPDREYDGPNAVSAEVGNLDEG
jgi:hypothetical protein